MTRPMITILALLTLALAAPVDAKNKESGERGFCPPGLAKKAVACVPPGLARKEGRNYQFGDRISDDDYHIVTYPGRYGLPFLGPDERYVIVNGQILKVDRDTFAVISLIRAVNAILD